MQHIQPGLVSILVPLFNEEEFIGVLLKRVLAAPLPEGYDREIVIVDDGSTDASVDVVRQWESREPSRIRLFTSDRNRGKGAAIRRAIDEAKGEFAIIQDADLEYDPRDYLKLLKPLVDNRADAVFGSRFLSASERRVLYFWHALANHILTGLCNMVADLNLTDMETCYKVFRMSLLKSIPIDNDRFGFEPEITIKLSKRQARIYEVPVNYHGRTYDEGKKIRAKDAFEALWTILKTAFSSNIYRNHDQAILHAFSHAKNFNRWMADTIRPYLGKRVLEIGAGMGNMTKQLAPGRSLYVSSDLNQEYLYRLSARMEHRPNVIARVCDLENTDDFEPFRRQMDSIVCLNVLEHAQDDMKALRNMRLALLPGGRVVILVPEGMTLYGSFDKVLGHFRRYSEEELRHKLEDAGFEVEKILSFNRISRPAWYVSGKVLRRKRISPLQLKLFDRFVWLWRKIDRFLPWKPTSLIAVAALPQTVPPESDAETENQGGKTAQTRG
jgi:glycosyltransferase involved in cell wall biosynthesis